MRTKVLLVASLLIIASMVLAACQPPAPTEAPAPGDQPAATELKSKDPTTFVDASIGEPETLDPALCYETAGAEILQNVYETLVFYDGGKTDAFVPQLAESWTLSDDGKTYTFKIRSGVKFHEGGDLTPSDVSYSFIRGILQAGTASPQWMLAEPFFGVGYDDPAGFVADKILAKVDGKADELVGAVDFAAFDEAAFGALFTDFVAFYNSASGFAVDAAAVLADEANVTAVKDMVAGLATAADDAAKKDAVKTAMSDLLGAAEGGDPYALYDDAAAMQKVDPTILKEVYDFVNSVIVADDAAGTVTMTLAQSWGPFFPTIAQTWGSVMDKEWVIENGGWDGGADWAKHYAVLAENDPFSTITNGTGPFKMDHWTKGEELVMVRNDAYWSEPAKLERVVMKSIDEWGTRFAMLQAGDADRVDVPVENRSQADELVGERCEFDMASNSYKDCEVVDDTKPLRLRIGRPLLQQDVFLFNYNIAAPDGNNPYIGSGKLDGNGVPQDFFSDIHIRKAFNYCFDLELFINDVFKGEAVPSVQLPLPGMPGYEADLQGFPFDMAKCEEEFKLADIDKDGIAAGDDPEGDIWTTGFRFSTLYNTGNTTRQIMGEILANNAYEINEKFIIELVGLPWPAYLQANRAKRIPLMVGGWLEDIHDPHNWYQPYITGTYGIRQSLPAEWKAEMKALLDKGVAETDPAKRAEIYYQMNAKINEEVPYIFNALSTSHAFVQRWVEGVVLNPIFPGTYFYTVSKK